MTKLNNSKDSIFSQMSELRFEMMIEKCFFGIKLAPVLLNAERDQFKKKYRVIACMRDPIEIYTKFSK